MKQIFASVRLGGKTHYIKQLEKEVNRLQNELRYLTVEYRCLQSENEVLDNMIKTFYNSVENGDVILKDYWNRR